MHPVDYAADAYGEIRARMMQIEEAERPRCPMSPGKLLYHCLRESSPCMSTCPNRGDWIGPQAP